MITNSLEIKAKVVSLKHYPKRNSLTFPGKLTGNGKSRNGVKTIIKVDLKAHRCL